MEGIAKPVGILAVVTGLAGALMKSDATLIGCETTPMESVIQSNRSKTMPVEKTMAVVGRQTNPTNKIILPTNKMIFPVNSLTTFIGRTMQSSYSVMLFTDFLRMS